MITTPIKELAATRGKVAQPERTVATELPQELSQLPAQYGFSDVNPFPKAVKTAAHGGGRKRAAGPKTRRRAVIATTGFMDDGHPTILAAARG